MVPAVANLAKKEAARCEWNIELFELGCTQEEALGILKYSVELNDDSKMFPRELAKVTKSSH